MSAGNTRRSKIQPQVPTPVDKNHWLAQKLQCAFIPAIAGGQDLMGNVKPIPVGTGTAGFTVKNTKFGKAAIFTSTTVAAHTSRSAYRKVGFPHTMIACCYFNNTSGSWTPVSMLQSTVGVGGEACYIRIAGSTAIEYLYRTGYGSYGNPYVTVAASVGETNMRCIVAQSLSALSFLY